MGDVDLTNALDAAAHKVTFQGLGVFGVKGRCTCGWSAKTDSLTGSDRVYWAAREHFAAIRPDDGRQT